MLARVTQKVLAELRPLASRAALSPDWVTRGSLADPQSQGSMGTWHLRKEALVSTSKQDLASEKKPLPAAPYCSQAAGCKQGRLFPGWHPRDSRVPGGMMSSPL